MKKYLVFLAGIAAQEIEASAVCTGEDCVTFYSEPDNDVVAQFERSSVIGWRIATGK